VAGRTPGDDPGRTNGAIEAEPVRIPGAPGAEETLAGAEQTLGDTDQTLSDADQTGSDSDQSSSDSDQLAADRDQAASDRDLASGVDREAHDFSRDVRQRSARQREQTAAARLLTAAQRDAGATARDIAALARDQAAAARDLAMSQRERADQQRLNARAVTGADVVLRAADQRRRAARHRIEAAEQRALAAEDRAAALQDREQAARERLQALADREALARQLAIAETDALTGVRARAAGLRELDHEIERCRRTGGSLVVAYIDVVGLKRLNDSEGHGAGDEMLKRVVAQTRAHVRSYDLLIRLGGDEFLCVMSNTTLHEVHRRFSLVADALEASPDPGGIRSGVAELTDNESAAELIARADGELIAHRG
jgi:diguanylate cyclase (GGDEF)-like protein